MGSVGGANGVVVIVDHVWNQRKKITMDKKIRDIILHVSLRRCSTKVIDYIRVFLAASGSDVDIRSIKSSGDLTQKYDAAFKRCVDQYYKKHRDDKKT